MSVVELTFRLLFSVSTLFQNVSLGTAAEIAQKVILGMCRNADEQLTSNYVLGRVFFGFNFIFVAMKALVNSTPPEKNELVAVLAANSVSYLIEAVCGERGSHVQVDACDILGDMVSK